MSLIDELKRRNVIRAGAAYAVTAWLIIQVVETIFPAFGFGNSGVRIVVIILAIGFIPTVILAWAFELTPDGLVPDSKVDRTSPDVRRMGKRLDRLIIAVLALALGLFAVDKFVLTPQQLTQQVEVARQQGRSEALVESYGEKSIAVLPFVNMSSDVEQEYFSDGISEELLNLLAKVPELRVISRSSAFSYKGKQIKISDVASELNVAHILEGSVRKAGGQVRITVQLIEANSDTHLWSETYDRTLDDIFAIQDEIAERVVKELRLVLLGEAPRVAETDPEAYALYLQGRHLGMQYTPESSLQAVALLQRAIDIDPEYAPAWRDLGNAYLTQVLLGQRSPDEAYTLAREAIGHALELDPGYAPAYTTLAKLAKNYEQDPLTAARHLERAIELEPKNPSVLWSTAAFLEFLGRFDEAIALKEHLVSLDPVEAGGYFSLGFTYYFAGCLDEAIENFRTTITLQPDTAGSHGSLGVAMLLNDDPESALAVINKEPFEVYRQTGLAGVYHVLGQTDESDAAMARLIKISAYEPYNIAWAHAIRGEDDQAFEWLHKELELNGLNWISVARLEPVFVGLHDDPRWQVLLEKAGLSDTHLSSINFNMSLLDY